MQLWNVVLAKRKNRMIECINILKIVVLNNKRHESLSVGIPHTHLACLQMELNVSQKRMCVLVLSYTLMKPVRLSIVPSLSETNDVHHRCEGDAEQEPRERACGTFGQRC